MASNNPFWNMATRGGSLPERFDLTLWQEAWGKSVRNLQHAMDTFLRRTTWENYFLVGKAITHASILRETMVHIPLFLGGCSENEQKSQEHRAIEEMESILQMGKTRTQAFLERQMHEGDAEHKVMARREYHYWDGFSPQRAECMRIEHEMMTEEHSVVFPRLTELERVPAMKAKFRAKAREMGVAGYAINVRDHDVSMLMGIQDQEQVRKAMWSAVQQHSPTQEKVNETILARLQWAHDSGYDTFMQQINQRAGGLSFNTVSKHIKNQIASLAPAFEQLTENHLKIGMRKIHWEQSLDAAKLPWNEGYLLDQAESGVLDLVGREFPLKRVLEHVIPDLLSVGGWRVVEKPKRVGRGKQALFLYRMTNGLRNGMMYFAPYPYQNIKDADPYQAYAAVLRERWVGPNQKHTTPIALVAQNLALRNGCLDDIEQLRYLAHEIGHVLHYLAFDGQTFDEFSRMPNNISEVPSLLLEQIADQPETLRTWANPKAKGAKRLSYWQCRRRPNMNSLMSYMPQLEEAYLDIRNNSSDRPLDNKKVRQQFRKEVGLSPLHAKDNTAYKNFDFTEHAGMSSTYIIGQAMAYAMTGKEMSDLKIRNAMSFLLDHILVHNSDHRLPSKWEAAYGKSMHQMFEEGFERMGQEHLRRAKASIKKTTRAA